MNSLICRHKLRALPCIRKIKYKYLEKLIIESFEGEGTKSLHQSRPIGKLETHNLKEWTDIEIIWGIIHKSVNQATEEGLGKRTVNWKTREYKMR